MLYTDWTARFPGFLLISEPMFDTLIIEAELEMGTATRWGKSYDIALGYLISHLATLQERIEAGDSTPLQPYRNKISDDVEVEYAVSRDMQNNFDPYASTSYGQQYIKWRRIYFAGPRVA